MVSYVCVSHQRSVNRDFYAPSLPFATFFNTIRRTRTSTSTTTGSITAQRRLAGPPFGSDAHHAILESVCPLSLSARLPACPPACPYAPFFFLSPNTNQPTNQPTNYSTDHNSLSHTLSVRSAFLLRHCSSLSSRSSLPNRSRQSIQRTQRTLIKSDSPPVPSNPLPRPLDARIHTHAHDAQRTQ